LGSKKYGFHKKSGQKQKGMEDKQLNHEHRRLLALIYYHITFFYWLKLQQRNDEIKLNVTHTLT